MIPVEALKMALKMEIEAIDLYKDYAIQFVAARETFEFLASEELKHKALIENKISELTSQ